ncbi:MAG: SUF system NifU family Fe-S cluster assembly protein [Polyangiaceae bacterium]
MNAKDLYQQAIVDHGKKPRNHGPLPDATHTATAHNPLCGDRVTVRLRIEGDRISDVRFEARGCMIATASTSLLTEAVRDHTIDEALHLAATIDTIASDGPLPDDAGSLEPLRGVRDFPARKPCVAIASQALKSALSTPTKPPRTT